MFKKIKEMIKSIVKEAFSEIFSEAREQTSVSEIDALKGVVGMTAVVTKDGGIKIVNDIPIDSTGHKIVNIKSVIIKREISLEGKRTELSVVGTDDISYRVNSDSLKSIYKNIM